MLENTTDDAHWPTYVDASSSDHNQDFFIEEDGITFAGTHLILDLWGVKDLNNINHIETILRQAITAANATLLHIHLHHFTPNGGVSGVAVLAESHISIHTWPERGYAALDVFMCGDAEPLKAIEVLKQGFKPENSTLTTHKRGIIEPSAGKTS